MALSKQRLAHLRKLEVLEKQAAIRRVRYKARLAKDCDHPKQFRQELLGGGENCTICYKARHSSAATVWYTPTSLFGVRG